MSSFWSIFGKEQTAAPEVEAAEPEAVEVPQQNNTVSAPPAARVPAPAPAALPQSTTPAYGVDDAIRLMRTLPVDENVDLVVRVIKNTLESLRVRVSDIIEDAGQRQEALRERITEYQSAIVQLEREIDARRHEIARLEEDLSETTNVRERLQLAEVAPPMPPARVSSPVSGAVGARRTGSADTPSAPGTASAGTPSAPSAVRNAPPLPSFRPKLGSSGTMDAFKQPGGVPAPSTAKPATIPPPPANLLTVEVKEETGEQGEAEGR